MALRDSWKRGSGITVPCVIRTLPSVIPAFAGMTGKGSREFFREPCKAIWCYDIAPHRVVVPFSMSS